MCYNRRASSNERKANVVRKIVIGFVIVAAVAAIVFVYLNRSGGEGSPVEESVRQTSVKRGDMMVSVSATGSIVPKSETLLSFDLPGKVAEVFVETGDSVARGDALARLDDAKIAFQVRQAQAALAAAQAQLDQLQAGPRPEEMAIAQANIGAAEAGFEGARASLRELQKGQDENQVAVAEANLRAAGASLQLAIIQRDQVAKGASEAEVAAAEAQVASALVQQKVARDTHDQTMKCQTVKLPDGKEKTVCPALGTIEEQARFNLFAADEAYEAAQVQLDQLLAGPTREQFDLSDVNVTAAEAQRDAAKAQVDILLAGASVEQIAAAQANVDALAAQRDATQAQFDLLLAGASAPQIAAAQANVDQAQVALDRALAELNDATLVAPFDGVVTAVNVQPDQMAPATMPAVTVADVSELKIVVNVDEIDVARIVEGQDVSITVDALSGERAEGQVKRIAPAASQLGGVVVYQVTIVLHDTDLPLRVGMSTTAAIITEELGDVLLVPNWAIRIDRDTGRTYVNLLQGDRVTETEVEIGVRSEDLSQVLSGLDEGDVVVAGDIIGLRSLLERGE
jgi:HlyD family secretion protein